MGTGHSTGRTLITGFPSSEGGRRSREQRGRHPSNQPPNDHAARATLGRHRWPRRPCLRESWDGTVSETVSVSVTESKSATEAISISPAAVAGFLHATPTRFLFTPLAEGATRCIVRHQHSTITGTPSAEQCNKWHPVRENATTKSDDPQDHALPTLSCDGSAPLRLCASALNCDGAMEICVYLCDLWVEMRCCDDLHPASSMVVPRRSP